MFCWLRRVTSQCPLNATSMRTPRTRACARLHRDPDDGDCKQEVFSIAMMTMSMMSPGC